ncbi:MAG TPA: Hsp33 family molecular chaperone HslO [Opitutaceae bacterium]|jgi:molecular chaperone Hsp33
MGESDPVNTAESGVEARTWFIRGRNVLAARAELGDLYVDYYLHLAKYRIHPEPEHDALFKRSLAIFLLHCTSRPWNEHHAWTINFQNPRVNVFLVADNESGAVTGRVFAENVKEMPDNLFYADVVRGAEPKRRSAVAFTGNDPLAAVEKFYLQSEQRMARGFQIAEEDFLLLTEHPDCDLAWLQSLTSAEAAGLDQNETLALLERRIYRWHCGCNQQRMMEVLAPAMRKDPEDIFGSEPKLEICCPRCGARHVITREAMESYIDDK